LCCWKFNATASRLKKSCRGHKKQMPIRIRSGGCPRFQPWQKTSPRAFRTPTERARLAQELTTKMNDIGDLFGVVREAQKLESDPEKVARFYATAFGELAGLDEAGRETAKRVARERFAEMKRAGLTAASRPRSDDSAWMESRCRAFDELDTALLATLTPERRLEAMKFGGIMDFTGRAFMPLGPAGEARK
jgi:hypothetical protein